MISAASAMIAAVPAWADKPPHPIHPTHPNHPSQSEKPGKSHGKGTCTPRDEGYYAKGTFVSGTLTPGTKKGRFNGTLTVDVTRANHDAPTGTQTYTLTDARVRFGKGVGPSSLAAGDRTVLHGTITVLPRKCSSAGFTPTITIDHARISAPKKH
jgi:hypothetical protein